MRTVKWNAILSGLCGFAVVLGGLAASARADVTTEKGASILIFPKVRADSTFDTIISLTNTDNSMHHARCFYVNAKLFTIAGTPCTVPSVDCTPEWLETDFTIWLTKQQPTHWLVSEGRDTVSSPSFGDNDSGFPPGRVPPVSDFEGELKCVEVTDTGDPLTGNHLKGEATIKVFETHLGGDNPVTEGDVSKYNAIGIRGNPDAQPDSNTLLLNGEVYDACPSKLILNHFATFSNDPFVEEEVSGVSSDNFTELTLVPCGENFETQQPTTTTIQFLIFNEFEQRISASTTVTCYLNTELSNIGLTTPELSPFSFGVLGSTVAQTEITPVPNLSDGSINAVVGVAERILEVTANGQTRTTRAITSMVTEGSLIPDAGPNTITLSDEEF